MNYPKGVMLILISILSGTITGCFSESDPTFFCTEANDCVPNKCCHPTELVNKKYGPNCNRDVLCTIAMEDQTKMDTNNWSPICKRNSCEVHYDG